MNWQASCSTLSGSYHTAKACLDSSRLYYFSINGSDAGVFYKKAPATDRSSSAQDCIYNVTVYRNESLPFGRHNFSMTVGREGGGQALVLLDAMMYDDGIER